MAVATQNIEKFLHCMPRGGQQNHIISISHNIQGQTSNVASYPESTDGLNETTDISGEQIRRKYTALYFIYRYSTQSLWPADLHSRTHQLATYKPCSYRKQIYPHILMTTDDVIHALSVRRPRRPTLGGPTYLAISLGRRRPRYERLSA